MVYRKHEARVVLHPLSTSNHNLLRQQGVYDALYCILFLHQTTTPPLIRYTPQRCIASSFYIKPQHAVEHLPLPHVVLHPLSTSNHNLLIRDSAFSIVVLHPLSTSNHNCPRHGLRDYSLYCILFLHQTTTSLFDKAFPSLLYCILFLHQTTTRSSHQLSPAALYCILFLHQTTTSTSISRDKLSCIASSFYIKPQLICQLG